jgi:Rrf2 family protein
LKLFYTFARNSTKMFSKACEYGIRALLYVARKSKAGVRVGIKDIAKAVDSPEPFMAKILQDLSRRGFVMSAKGPNGGFFMEARQMAISLADVVEAIDGDQLFKGCGLGLRACNEKKPCPIHFEFKAIRANIKTMLESTALQDFTENLESGLYYLKRA